MQRSRGGMEHIDVKKMLASAAAVGRPIARPAVRLHLPALPARCLPHPAGKSGGMTDETNEGTVIIQRIGSRRVFMTMMAAINCPRIMGVLWLLGIELGARLHADHVIENESVTAILTLTVTFIVMIVMRSGQLLRVIMMAIAAVIMTTGDGDHHQIAMVPAGGSVHPLVIKITIAARGIGVIDR